MEERKDEDFRGGEVTFPEHDGRIILQADVNQYFAYSLYQNNTSIVRSVVVRNTSGEDMKQLSLRIYTDTGLMDPFTETIDLLPAGGEYELRRPKLCVHGEYLASLTERTLCNLVVSVTKENAELAAEKLTLVALAYNEWTGLRYLPDLLVSFVMPNHPAVSGLLRAASGYLEKWTGSPSLDAYQSGDPNRVLCMAAAAYAAVQELNITYASAPASYEDVGQRVRLIDEIMEMRLANCMDLTMLYTAVLEAMRLNPILVMIDGHIFAGVWLVDNVFPESFSDDPTQLEKRVARGISELLLVECTSMCAGATVSFDDARAKAEAAVGEYSAFEFTIDVVRSRRSGIRPLPVRVKGDSGFTILHQERTEEEVTSRPEQNADILELGLGERQEVTKQIQWERKLLDLSMRNMLINMRISGSVIPVLAGDLCGLEDALAEGAEFELLERPQEWTEHNITQASIETVNDLGPYTELITSEAKHHRLHSWLSGKELSKLLTRMYRSARSSMEENGASTVYLTLGQLRWVDGIKVKKEHYAPLVLIPIDIIRKSANQGYVIRERDDESQINITLLEYLKQTFDLEIPGLLPPPKDDHGLDIEKIFAIVRHGVMGQKMWDVIENAFIGNFSFSQFVMWNDIHNHADLLGRNKIVRALMNGAIDWDTTLPETFGETEEAYLPISADASQQRAINLAAAGSSFVLHGPPGTGKSQTITAMIANALSRGKTVLFVAEKMAALEVVQKRLAALGIGDFCLELHSNKAVKKNVLDQLRRGLEIGVWGGRTDYDEKIAEIREMRVELDGYGNALHEERAWGLSVRQMIDRYESIPEQTKTFRPAKELLEQLRPSDFERHGKLLTRLIDAGKTLGHPKGHIFSDVGQTEYTQSLRMNLEYTLDEMKQAMRGLEAAAETFSRSVMEPNPVTEAEWNERRELADALITSRKMPAFLRNAASVEELFRIPRQYITMRDQFFRHREGFFARYQPGILNVDFAALSQKYAAAQKKLFGKAKAIEEVATELQANVKSPVTPEEMGAVAEEVNRYKQAVDEYQRAKDYFPQFWAEYVNEATSMAKVDQLQADWTSELGKVNRVRDKLDRTEQAGKTEEALKNAGDFMEALRIMDEAMEKLSSLLVIGIRTEPSDVMGGRRSLISKIETHPTELRDWIGFMQVKVAAEAEGLQEICRLYVEGLEHDEVIPVYFKSMYKAMIWEAIESEPVLNRFTGHKFSEKIREFREADQELQELTKKEMYYILTHQLPTGHEGVEMNRELAILRKAISSGGRGQSIRSLFEQIPHVLRKLCPCLLMSPISVAQYLAADGEPYDIVIFDEASQLPTCKAVGVLARGENAVIVGDPNQMPPTSFFAGNMIDEDNLDIEDLDSILDDCLALGMPGSHLKWHYRSRHESLIAFSNQEYYENSMLTFPSVNDRERRVKLCTVNGCFNRRKGRINEEEGTAVVREVLRRFRNPGLSERSVGIVTFNVTQQAYIEDLLAEEYRKDAAFDRWANEGEEPLFVKNLENVQGDERDVILFSVSYGPDEEGRLSLNFGPLNKEGGWKRLNVAVTRARSEMIVFSSMTPEMIDLNRTKARGVEGLRDFLEYADRGKLSGRERAVLPKAEGILREITETIEAEGLRVERNVGHSDFKVDIAVGNPYNEDEYLLGILLDGDSYKQTANTRDREIAQISVLAGLGWKLFRMWTMDWWDNREEEIRSLKQILCEAKERAALAAEEKKEEDSGPESQEITFRKENAPGRKKKKKEKEEAGGNSSFDAYDRFTPLTPHRDSKDEYKEFVQEQENQAEGKES